MGSRQQAGSTYYRTEGSLALRATSSPARLRVIEGGRAAREERPQVVTGHQRGNVSLAIVVAAIIVMLTTGSVVRDVLHERHVRDMLSQASYKTVVVHAGATLWEIAEDNPFEGCSTTEQIDSIREINQLTSGALQAGMELQVPISS